MVGDEGERAIWRFQAYNILAKPGRDIPSGLSPLIDREDSLDLLHK